MYVAGTAPRGTASVRTSEPWVFSRCARKRSLQSTIRYVYVRRAHGYYLLDERQEQHVMPKITVIIPTFNRELFVMRAIDSVLNQSFKDYEIVVVDDGSTDNTQSTVRRFGSKIRYIYQKNAGVSAARNTGIEAAACEWVAFLDSDDEWATEYLSWQMERADGRSRRRACRMCCRRRARAWRPQAPAAQSLPS